MEGAGARGDCREERHAVDDPAAHVFGAAHAVRAVTILVPTAARCRRESGLLSLGGGAPWMKQRGQAGLQRRRARARVLGGERRAAGGAARDSEAATLPGPAQPAGPAPGRSAVSRAAQMG